MPRLVFFDCDSTLSAIEGIDELARLRGPEVFADVERMTSEAMGGGTPLEEIFARRLEIIRPTAAELAHVGALYIEHVEPHAAATVAALRAAGWTPIIVSGGFREAILPLAAHLGIERVEAVGLRFDDAGNYLDFDRAAPTARSHGKNAVIVRLKAELLQSAAAAPSASPVPSSPSVPTPVLTVMVGDGASDLETAPDVNLFVGFGRYAVREKVRAGAGAFIGSLAALPEVLEALAQRFPAA
jgi:phosphoserine phosphatase